MPLTSGNRVGNGCASGCVVVRLMALSVVLSYDQAGTYIVVATD